MSLWLKKLNVFLMEKHSIFQNNKVKNFKDLEIFQSRRDFFKCLQVITFDTFLLANSNFLHMFYTGNTTGKKILSSRRVIQNPEVLSQYLKKMKIL